MYQHLLAFLFATFLTTTWAQLSVAPKVPSSSPPAGCLNSVVGTFNLIAAPLNGTTWIPGPDATLTGGVMSSQRGTTFTIGNNYVLVDSGNLADTLYTGGWSICTNGTVTLGSQTTFWECPAIGPIWQQRLNDSCVETQLEVQNIKGALYSTSLTVVSSQTQTTLSVSTQASTTLTTPQASLTVFVTTTATLSPGSSSSASSGLSTGAKAGIGVGAAIGGLLIVILGLFLLRRRRSRTNQEKAEEKDVSTHNTVANGGALYVQQQSNRAELPSKGAYKQEQEKPELASHDRVGTGLVELDAQQQRQRGGGPAELQ